MPVLIYDVAGEGKGGLFGCGGRPSDRTFADLGGAASDLFAADAYRAKAAGSAYEQQNYMLAAQCADQNEPCSVQLQRGCGGGLYSSLVVASGNHLVGPVPSRIQVCPLHLLRRIAPPAPADGLR
jgi:hypothetical protein